MSAKAILVAKLNSHPFEDRVLLLDVPAKIGRSHKDDQVKKKHFYEYYLENFQIIIEKLVKI